MRHIFAILIGLVWINTNLNGQVAVENSKKLKDNYLLTYGIGAGYRHGNTKALNDFLKLPNDNSLSNHKILLHFEVGAELYKRMRVGLLADYFLSAPKSNLGTTYSLFELNGGLYLGYNFLVKEKMKLSLNYQFSGELQTLTARSEVSNSTLEEALKNRNTANAIAEFTAHQPFVRLELFSKTMMNEKAITTASLGVDLGYSFSTFKGWSDDSFNTITGPKIDNNGFFFRLSALQTIKFIKAK